MPLALDILSRFAAGDADAFLALYREYRPLTYRIATRFFRGEFEREEALQEVWLQVFRQRAALDLHRADAVEGWLATMARNRCLDLVRASRPDQPAPAELPEIEAPAEQDRALENRQLADALARFAERLKKPQLQAVFRLAFVEDRPLAEIADALGISRLRAKYLRKLVLIKLRKSADVLAALGRGAA